MKTTIGILAGMGPRSTAPFIDMVVTECQKQIGATFDEEYPPMMIYSVPVPFRADEPPDWSVIRHHVLAGLKRLESTGVDFIAIPCNTVHILYDELAKSVGVPVLNMIDETLEALPSTSRKIAVLATRMTVDAGLYQNGIERAGLQVASRNEWQGRVDRLITNIKTSPDRDSSQRMWDGLVRDIVDAGAEAILLGCTDLNALNTHVPAGTTLIDATASLAKSVVRRYIEKTGLVKG